MRSSVPVFIGWPTEGIEYWNGYWRHQAVNGFFDDMCAETYQPDTEAHTMSQCADLARGFCPASVDGYCVGGTEDGRCHG